MHKKEEASCEQRYKEKLAEIFGVSESITQSWVTSSHHETGPTPHVSLVHAEL